MTDPGTRGSISGLQRFLDPARSAGAASPPGGVVDLRRFLEPRPRPIPGERCELCTEILPDEHSHVVNIETRTLLCACRGCWLLFTSDGAARGKLRAVPPETWYDPAFQLTEAQWDRLQVPVATAFFFRQSDLPGPVGFYPSPAGATESLLPLEIWDELVAANPALAAMLPDVQALLVHRPPGGARQCFIVPIDACYQLVGLIRRTWKGFDGGEEAAREIAAFFGALAERSRPPSVPA